MSLEDVLERLESISEKVDSLTTDVTNLKEKERVATGGRPSRSRSRSPHESRTRRERTWLSRDRTSERSWGDRDPAESPDFTLPIHSSDEEDGPDGSQLVEVSEGTYRLLKTSCTRSMSNDLRRRTRSVYKFPRVEATRTPKVDQVIKSLASQSAKSADRELARIQTFVLDSFAPVSSLLEQVSHESDRVSIEDVKLAALTAAELIGNASAQISRLRREKMVTSINNLLPLVKEDGDFLDVAPNLFGPDISKWAKDHLDQVKSLRAAMLPPRQASYPQSTYNKPGSVIRTSGRGQARGRGGGPTFKGTHSGRELPVNNSKYPNCFFCNECNSEYSVNSRCDCSQGYCSPAKSCKSSRLVGTFHNQLAKGNKEPVGPEYGYRVRDRSHLRTPPTSKTMPKPIKSKPAGAGISRDHRDDLKRGGDRVTNPTRGQFFLHPLSGAKKGWRSKTSNKL